MFNIQISEVGLAVILNTQSQHDIRILHTVINDIRRIPSVLDGQKLSNFKIQSGEASWPYIEIVIDMNIRSEGIVKAVRHGFFCNEIAYNARPHTFIISDNIFIDMYIMSGENHYACSREDLTHDITWRGKIIYVIIFYKIAKYMDIVALFLDEVRQVKNEDATSVVVGMVIINFRIY